MQIFKMMAPMILISHGALVTVLIIVIRKMLLSDTLKAVEKIQQVEAEVREKEEAIRQEIEQHEKEFAEKKIEAEKDLQRKKEETEKEVSQLREKIVAEAKKESDKIIEKAHKQEAQLREQLMMSIEEKAVDYGAQIFKMVATDTIEKKMNSFFVAELLDALEELDTSAITVDGDNYEFISSHELLPEHRERLERIVKDKFGKDIKVNEKVDPNILAGLIFKLGSLEIDGSLLNRYKEAAVEVKKSALN